MVSCELKFCIYNCDKICLLDSISVSCEGICNEIIMIDIDDDRLEEIKKKMLDDIVKRRKK